MKSNLRMWALVAAVTALGAAPSAAQDVSRVVSLRAVPENPTVELGGTAPFRVEAVDASGNVVPGVEIRVGGRGVAYADGRITGQAGGSQILIAALVVPADFQGTPAQLRVPVEVTWPAVARI
ncbi:MAG TPA: hypothetical protein VLA43_11100, partial [Longimicrobiales bacterium]|nr:hypothetical protein [Longimicrobiales bacterium]